jgi:hypothetical protein
MLIDAAFEHSSVGGVCDERHSAFSDLLLCYHCTVVPGGAFPSLTEGR